MARFRGSADPEPVRPVSKAEREAVLAFLGRLVERDQVSFDQFSELTDKVLRARDYDELTRTLAVLPAPFPRTPADQRSRKRLVVRARITKQDMTGTWHVPRKIVVRVTSGKASLDFTNALFDEQQVEPSAAGSTPARSDSEGLDPAAQPRTGDSGGVADNQQLAWFAWSLNDVRQ